MRPANRSYCFHKFFATVLAGLALLPALPASAASTKTPTEQAVPAPSWPALKQLAGKVVLVDFWASWCGPCLQSFPWMNELQQRHAGDGLVILAVNVDQERALAEAFLKKLPPKFRIEYDQAGDLAKKFGVEAMPTSFLVDRQGRVRTRHAGFRNAQRAEREQQIQELLKEQP